MYLVLCVYCVFTFIDYSKYLTFVRVKNISHLASHCCNMFRSSWSMTVIC